MSTAHRYFPTFDALRFVAFLMVFFTHIPLPANWRWLGSQGGNGVAFFFVLSGFLITYILLVNLQTGHRWKNLRNFFVRRILRIWPLYFACLLFAWATPHILNLLGLGSSTEGYAPNWLISATFLENYRMMITDSYPDVSPLRVTWSICIEEHFYLLWTLLFGWLSTRRTPYILAVGLLTPILVRYYYFHYTGWPFLDLLSNFDFFAWGGLVAWILHRFPKNIDDLTGLSPLIKYAWVGLVLGLLALDYFNDIAFFVLVWPLLIAPAFAGLLTWTLPLGNRLFIGNEAWFSRWGQYTYGLYMLHTIVINLCLRLLPKVGIDPVVNWSVLALVSFLGSLSVAWMSYRLLERPFLKLKDRFR